jgi:nucleotide-binding universal stress UspA family protein
MPNSAADLGIRVGVDGSSSSNSAVRWAAQEARMRNVPLTLVHVVVAPAWGPTPWLLSDAPLPIPAEEDRTLEVVGPHSVPIRAHADCSVLIVRGERH